MRNKWPLFGAIFDIIVGVAGILSFIIIYVSGDSVKKWLPSLVLSIIFLIIGVCEFIHWRKR